MKNTHGGVLLLVKNQAKACNFTSSNTRPWEFFTFFNCTNGNKSYKASEISNKDLRAGHTGVLRILSSILKACVRYFLINFYFSPNDSPPKTMKGVFYFILKAFFVLEMFNFLYFHLPLFFSLSTIALELDPRLIVKFMTSITV